MIDVKVSIASPETLLLSRQNVYTFEKLVQFLIGLLIYKVHNGVAQNIMNKIWLLMIERNTQNMHHLLLPRGKHELG